ncbi:MAG: hypothetical protein IKI50_07595, partial [Clostridia bacterium]|nr:hypothetical protein [Clostridia bacterium]
TAAVFSEIPIVVFVTPRFPAKAFFAFHLFHLVGTLFSYNKSYIANPVRVYLDALEQQVK